MTGTLLRLDLGAATDVGRVRTSNEDSLLVAPARDAAGPALVAVADGMGGHNAGEVASDIAVRALAAMFEQIRAGTQMEELEETLGKGVQHTKVLLWNEE